MTNPYFSIVIPSYNRAHLIVETIHAILNQEFTDFELLIIDDASTDQTEHVIDQINDGRIHYHKNEINLERSASRNKGIDLAKGKYICFCDSDDHWKSNHLQLLFEKINSENEPVAMFFTGMVWNFPDRKQEVIFPSPEGENLIEYVIKNQIGTPTTCFHHTILEKLNFSTALQINEDVELFARVVSEHPLIQIPLATVDVMIHAENTRGLVKNYISPQLVAMELIFNNALIKNKLSTEFKREIIRNLRHQLINFYYESNESKKLIVEVSRFLLKYPRDWQNKSKIFMLLQHLPITKQILNNRKN
jgi:glycosyltransferase involved in cell wall biosynthesis